MERKQKVAVLLTCHNRRLVTLSCLEALGKQVGLKNFEIEAFLVIDGCTDGTAEAVTKRFPSVRQIQGSGVLFWCGGMREAWVNAARESPDFYIWLNDDTTLYPDAIRQLLSVHAETHSECMSGPIVVGTCAAPSDGRRSYGGFRVRRPVSPGEKAVQIETFNGNIVLVPANVYHRIGGLSEQYRHSFGDIDYGLRAGRAGVPVLLAPGFLGTCEHNKSSTWSNPSVPLRQRWPEFHSAKGVPPLELIQFAKQSVGYLWPLVLIKAYLRLLLPSAFRHRNTDIC